MLEKNDNCKYFLLCVLTGRKAFSELCLPTSGQEIHIKQESRVPKLIMLKKLELKISSYN